MSIFALKCEEILSLMDSMRLEERYMCSFSVSMYKFFIQFTNLTIIQGLFKSLTENNFLSYQYAF